MEPTPHAPIRRFLADEQRRGILPNTLRKREQLLTRWVTYLDGMSPFDAGPDDFAAWLDSCKIGDRARYAYISHVHSFYRWAIRHRLTLEDPTERVDRPRMRRLLPRPVTDDQLSAALVTSDPTLSLILHLMAFGGLRCMEVATLAVDDVALDLGVLRVVGKGGNERIVPLHPDLRRAIGRVSAPVSGPLVRDQRGRPFAPYAISRLVSIWLRGAGVDATAHQLRHWFGTRVYGESRDLRVTQEVMGHGSPVTTAGYARWSPEDARKAVEAIRLHPAGEQPAEPPPSPERGDDTGDEQGQTDEQAAAHAVIGHRTPPAPTRRTGAPHARRHGRRRRSR